MRNTPAAALDRLAAAPVPSLPWPIGTMVMTRPGAVKRRGRL